VNILRLRNRLFFEKQVFRVLKTRKTCIGDKGKIV
jgi:hypothetical protein